MFALKLKIFLFVIFSTLAILNFPVLSSVLRPVKVIKFIDPNKLINHSKETIENFYRNLEHEELVSQDVDKKKE